MEIPVVYNFTHDSIAVGEDGPTHQPIEHLASLRAIPGLIIHLRPCDANEVLVAWKVIMEMRHEPVCLILTRQAVPTLDRTKFGSAEGVRKGAYVLADAPGGKPDVLLLATGSEVTLCMQAYEQLKAEGIKARVVSMPSWEMFEHYCRDNAGYRESVLPSAVTARVSVELASTFGWEQYRRINRASIGHEDLSGRRRAEGTAKEVRLQPRKMSWPPPRSSCGRGFILTIMIARLESLAQLAGLEQTIKRGIVHRTLGRIRRLEVELTENHLVIRGWAESFHLKQLVIQGMFDVIGMSGPRRFDIDVRIVVGPLGSDANAVGAPI